MSDRLGVSVVVGRPYRAQTYHTHECRHVKTADGRVEEATDAVVEHHDLTLCQHCDTLADGREANHGPQTSVASDLESMSRDAVAQTPHDRTGGAADD